MMASQQHLGIIEAVSLPLLGVSHEYAKIDTGAYSGSIHCHSIKKMRGTNGIKFLRVVPIDVTHASVDIYDFKVADITSSTGHRVRRYIITTPIVIDGNKYEINISLATRDRLKVKILIGRRFLRKYQFLVDVTKNQELDGDGGNKL
jgi:hypothetical protein